MSLATNQKLARSRQNTLTLNDFRSVVTRVCQVILNTFEPEYILSYKMSNILINFLSNVGNLYAAFAY